MDLINRNPKIFILAGKARAGKDTSAAFIKEYYEKQNNKVLNLQYSFYLKEYAKKITGWDGLDETKPRELLQTLGTSLIRKKIDYKLLVRRMIEDLKIMSYFFDVIIISDARLIEELEEPKEELPNVKTIKVIRPNFDNGLTESQKNDLTELSLDNYDNYDYKIINDSTIEALQEQIVKVLKEEI